MSVDILINKEFVVVPVTKDDSLVEGILLDEIIIEWGEDPIEVITNHCKESYDEDVVNDIIRDISEVLIVERSELDVIRDIIRSLDIEIDGDDTISRFAIELIVSKSVVSMKWV